MRKCCLLVAIFVVSLFVNICDANAEKIETSDGYAKCIYTGVVSEQNPPSAEEAYRTSVSVAIRVYRDTGGVVRSYANLEASETYLASWDGIPNMVTRQILNYNDLFHHAQDKLYPTFGDGGWKCPKYIWINIDPANPAAGASIYLNNSNGGSSLALNSKFSGASNTAGDFDSDDDYEEFIDSTDIGDPEGGVSVTPGGESGGGVDDDDTDGNKVPVASITEWAASQGYDVNSIGDPCSIISPKLQSLLNTIFWAISIIGIILVVVMTALGFIKAIVGSDDEKFRDAFRHLLTRIIVVIILLLLPAILSFIITLINDSSTGEVTVGKDGNVFCDIAN